MKTISLIGTALVAVGIMTSCSSTKPSAPVQAPAQSQSVPEAQATPAAVATSPLTGEWSITEVGGTTVVVNGENHPKLSFEADESNPSILKVIGFNGCNYINGAWNVTGDAVKPAGEFISSLRSCPDAPYETAVNRGLNETTAYRLTGDDNLELLSAGGNVVMKLRRRNLSFLNGAWRVTAIHGNAVPATADIRVVIDIDECRIHGNAGCNLLNGEIVVNLDKGDALEFRNLATSRMTCPNIATEQEFLLSLEEVDTAVKADAGDEALFKDSQGKVVITMKRMSPDELVDE